MSSPDPGRRPDADYSLDILEELYSYPLKRAWVAWLLWFFLGWVGAHRFYLGRPFTGTAMVFTLGGAFVWWLGDGLFVPRMLRAHNTDQRLREREGRPPRGLDAMPPLDRRAVTGRPDWVTLRASAGRGRRLLRLAGDATVLLFAASVLGTLVRVDGGIEAGFGVAFLAAVTASGAGLGRLERIPVLRGLGRWSHRLRLFYHHNEPAPPPLLLIRPIVGLLWAPFRAKDRAEVKLYVEVGAVFTVLFLLGEAVPDLLVPALLPGRSADVTGFVAGEVAESLVTFFMTYAFAAPIGAVLTRNLLVEESHRVPRALAVLTLVALGMGMLSTL